MAKRRLRPIYERVFFDRLLLVGIIFLSVTYVTRNTWVGAFSESAAFVVGIVWSYRAITTHPSRVFRLLAALIMLLLGSLLALYLGKASNLI